jgi:hypothetical protein
VVDTVLPLSRIADAIVHRIAEVRA